MKPTNGEVRNCHEFLKRTLKIINPKFVCCLGEVAAKRFLGKTSKPLQTKQGERVLRGVHKGKLVDGIFIEGKFDEGITVVCTYHPTGRPHHEIKHVEKEIIKDIRRFLIKEMKASGLK